MVLFRLILGLYMYEDIKEQIAVAAVFKNGHALPHSFVWKNRKYLVDQINLEHTEKRGDNILFCFSLTSSGNFYELSFDNINLVWKLEKIWQ